MKEFIEELSPGEEVGHYFEKYWPNARSSLDAALGIMGFLAEKQYEAIDPVLQAFIDRQLTNRIIAVLQAFL